LSTGYQDFQYLAGVNILGVAEEVEFTIKEVIGTVDVNIESVAGTVVFDVNVQGTVDVNIKSQETNITVTGTVDINAVASVVKIEPSEEAVFEIKPQAGVVFNISGDVNANITNETVDVNITNSSVTVVVQSGTINANITNTSINVNVQNKVDVEIKNASIDVNVTNSVLSVSVSGQASVSIDNASVYLNVQNEKYTGELKYFDFTSDAPDLLSDYAGYGVLIRNARGFLRDLRIKVKNLTSSNQTLTFCLSIDPTKPPIFEKDFTVPADLDGEWTVFGFFNIWWSYDTLFIYVKETNTNVQFYAKNVGWTSNAFVHYSAGVGNINFRIAVNILKTGSHYGTIPVSGTVNTINIPNRTARTEYSGPLSPSGWTTAIDTEFIGTLRRIVIQASEAKLVNALVRLTIDGEEIFETSPVVLAENGFGRMEYAWFGYWRVIIDKHEFPVKNSVKIDLYVEQWREYEPHASVRIYYDRLG